MSGIFRQVCLNGLCVADSIFETARIRHQGYTDEKIVETIFNIIDSLPIIASKIETFQSIKVNPEEKQIFAESVLDLVFEDSVWVRQECPWSRPAASKVNTAKILTSPRRSSDSEDNLWNIYNRMQERLMKGGLCLVSECGKYRIGNSSRAIKSIDKNVKLNKALWLLTEQMAKLKAGVN